MGARLRTISPFFIVRSLAASVSFYESSLGFDVRYAAPEDSPFFAIVGRDDVQVHLKEIGQGIDPVPNSTRHEWAEWDAFVYTDDPRELAQQLKDGPGLHSPLTNRSDGLFGFEVADPDGYVLFFGHPRTSAE